MTSFLPDGYQLPKRQKPERKWLCRECSGGEQPFQLAGISKRCELCFKDYAFGKFEKELGTWKPYIPINTMR